MTLGSWKINGLLPNRQCAGTKVDRSGTVFQEFITQQAVHRHGIAVVCRDIVEPECEVGITVFIARAVAAIR